MYKWSCKYWNRNRIFYHSNIGKKIYKSNQYLSSFLKITIFIPLPYKHLHPTLLLSPCRLSINNNTFLLFAFYFYQKQEIFFFLPRNIWKVAAYSSHIVMSFVEVVNVITFLWIETYHDTPFKFACVWMLSTCLIILIWSVLTLGLCMLSDWLALINWDKQNRPNRRCILVFTLVHSFHHQGIIT